MPRIYKIQRQGGAYYLCLPTFLVTEEMLKQGVTIELLEYSKEEILMKVKPAGEHNKNREASGEDTSQSRSASNLRKTN